MAERPAIDAVLRDVPLPDGLEDRLALESLFDDDAVDRLLRRVPVPVGLAGRIRTATFQSGRGVDLDRAAFVQAAAHSPRAAGPRSRGPVTIPAIAISLAAVVGLVFIVIGSGRPWQPRLDGPAVVLATTGPQRTAGPGDMPIGMDPAEPAPSLDPADPLPASVDPADGLPERLVIVSPDAGDAPRRGPQTVRGASLGSGAAGDPGGMRVVGPARAESRRRVPRIAGFDLAFEMAHGEMPFVDPQAGGLAIDQPPLSTHTGSFDALRFARSRRPRSASAAELRTEDALAALPATAGSAADEPRLRIHAVRSLRGRPESCLVEICAVAPPLAREAEAAVDAVLVLAHEAIREPLEWSWICRSLESVADQMREGDRVSVVIGGGRPRMAGDRLAAAALRRLAVGLAAAPPAGAVDLDAALRVATADGAEPPRPVVVVADVEAVDGARAEGRTAVTAWREALVRSVVDAPRTAPVRFVLVDSAEPPTREPSEPGFGRTPADAREIARAVVERVFGVSTLAVRQCRLEVQFDPQLVAAYRLVGHRQSALESLADATPPAIDLHAGEAARVVYELVPRGPTGVALAARLSGWLAGGGRRLVTAELPLQAVERAALPSPRGCELLLAVGLGELASGSPHALPRSAISQALTELVAAWRTRGDVTAAGAAIVEAGTAAGIFKTAKPSPVMRP